MSVLVALLLVGADGHPHSRAAVIAAAYRARTEVDAPDSSVILFVGDGMGREQRKAARWASQGMDGSLAMDQMFASGLAGTKNAEGGVTDSAAAGTALASGVKTTNSVLGLDTDGHVVETILERAQARGKAVGLVTTVQLAHATPAAFASHIASRNEMTNIAAQMMAHEVDVLLGGGENQFLPRGEIGCHPQAGDRIDGRNLIDEAIGAGYTYVCGVTAFDALEPASVTKVLGLFADRGMTRPFSPTLEAMTETAIAILSQDPDGFFLMVEAGQIDWAGHANDAANAVSDTLGLDRAVAVAQSYAAGRDDVLLVVTADHETGGMSVSTSATGVSGEDGPFHMPDGTPFYVTWATTGHTSADVPVTAQGKEASSLVGAYENTYIYDVMDRALLDWTVWLPVVGREGS